MERSDLVRRIESLLEILGEGYDKIAKDSVVQRQLANLTKYVLLRLNLDSHILTSSVL